MFVVTKHAPTYHCIYFYIIFSMYLYRLQIKWDYKTKNFMSEVPFFPAGPSCHGHLQPAILRSDAPLKYVVPAFPDQ
jgi:hypothetical protein